ncbi:MAG: hypothetical protein AABW72_01470 [archaeon]
MVQKIISGIGELSLIPNINLEQLPQRKKAVQHYFSDGGILKLDISKEAISLAYPTKSRLQQMIKEKQSAKSDLEKKKTVWKNKYNEAKQYYAIQNIKKFSSPIYWKHVVKCVQDKNYKTKADKIKLPVHLVSDQRWQPMVKTFLENEDYRNQLTETVENSLVYKDKKEVAGYAKKLQEFREEHSLRNVKNIDEKIIKLEKSIESLQELMKWANK